MEEKKTRRKHASTIINIRWSHYVYYEINYRQGKWNERSVLFEKKVVKLVNVDTFPQLSVFFWIPFFSAVEHGKESM